MMTYLTGMMLISLKSKQLKENLEKYDQLSITK